MSKPTDIAERALEQMEKTVSVATLDRLDEFDHPFTVNEWGLWCNACGEHIAAAHNIDETYVPPENCKKCGWPDEFNPEEV